ncbi:YopT-type cysteine protease domain-containing protein [Microbulbifer sp.]|uniref:YopT-type cysteine protease domain-containing protein n=1 Tax=Microbulbifer sp. TaxID=1908541 RepID=UPI003F2C3F41
MNVKRLAESHHGYQQWSFSQAHMSTWIHYRNMGICASLVAHWIRDHANGDSLVNELGSGGVGPLNIKKLREIAHDQRKWRTHGEFSQHERISLWLSHYGIDDLRTSANFKRVARIDYSYGGRVIWSKPPGNKRSYEVASGRSFRPMIEKEITDTLEGYQKSCYARVAFGNRMFGHSIAVWLGQPIGNSRGDACFFDPNYGEYWFEEKQDFFKFFKAFYRAKYKHFPCYFGHRWYVAPCAKKV